MTPPRDEFVSGSSHDELKKRGVKPELDSGYSDTVPTSCLPETPSLVDIEEIEDDREQDEDSGTIVPVPETVNGSPTTGVQQPRLDAVDCPPQGSPFLVGKSERHGTFPTTLPRKDSELYTRRPISYPTFTTNEQRAAIVHAPFTVSTQWLQQDANLQDEIKGLRGRIEKLQQENDILKQRVKKERHMKENLIKEQKELQKKKQRRMKSKLH